MKRNRLIISAFALLLCITALSSCRPAQSRTDTSSSSASSSASSSSSYTSSDETSSEIEASDETRSEANNKTVSTGYTSTDSGDYSTSYVTNPSNWTSEKSGRRTVQNLPAASFDEDKYYGIKIPGGSIIRSGNYKRGIGYDTIMANGSYPNDPAIIAKDQSNIALMNVNSFRRWTHSSNAAYEDAIRAGVTRTDTMTSNGFLYMFAQSKARNGNTSGHVFSDLTPARKSQIENYLRSEVTGLTSYEGMGAFLLANEPANWRDNGGGFDDVTIANFRVWLQQRFGTIGSFNASSGLNLSSFAAVSPGTDTQYSNTVMRYEHYLFMKDSYEKAIKFISDTIRAVNPKLPFAMGTYAEGRDPYGSYARIGDYMNVGAANIYAVNPPSPRRNLSEWSFDVDRLLAMYKNKPFYITETGWWVNVANTISNPFGDLNCREPALRLKQLNAIAYMRPQIHGSYWFNYGYKVEHGNRLWGIVDDNRNPIATTHALSQFYTHAQYLDQFFVGASASPVVGVTDQQVDHVRSGAGAYDVDFMMTALYAKGVGIQVVPTADPGDINSLKLDKMILTDRTLYQNPDGSDDVASAIVNYLNKGNSVLTLNDTLPKTLYGKNNGLGASTPAELKQKYSKFSNYSDAETYDDIWNRTAPFIHGDFIKGKVSPKKGTVDSSAVRILDSYTQSDGLVDPAWQVHQQLLYKDGRLYLCVVNTGLSTLNDFSVTIGVNKGVQCNLRPTIMASDGNVTAVRSPRAIIPSWVSAADSQIAYGTLTINNLSTYAFIDLGMAVV